MVPLTSTRLLLSTSLLALLLRHAYARKGNGTYGFSLNANLLSVSHLFPGYWWAPRGPAGRRVA